MIKPSSSNGNYQCENTCKVSEESGNIIKEVLEDNSDTTSRESRGISKERKEVTEESDGTSDEEVVNRTEEPVGVINDAENTINAVIDESGNSGDSWNTSGNMKREISEVIDELDDVQF